MTSRRTLVLAAAMALGVIAWLVLLSDDDAPIPPAAEPQATAPAARVAPPGPALQPTPIVENPPPPELATDDPPALPPPDYKPAERPAQTPMTQDGYIERRAKGLQLLDDTIARITRERDAARQAGRDHEASLASVRLERLATLRTKRAQELEQARRGELKPNPDDEPAGARPAEPR